MSFESGEITDDSSSPVDDLFREESLTTVSLASLPTTRPPTRIPNQPQKVVIKENNFQNEINAIKKEIFSEEQETNLNSVFEPRQVFFIINNTGKRKKLYHFKNKTFFS